jgi:hypothetical protein
MEEQMNDADLLIATLVKGTERYVFVFTREKFIEAIRTVGRFASDPDLSMTFPDAGKLIYSMSRQTQFPLRRFVEIGSME